MGTFPRGIPLEQRILRLRADRATTEAQPKQPKWASKLPGDPLSLRGIPAIGMGVQGAITGTRPGTNLTASESRATNHPEQPGTPGISARRR